MSDLHLLRPEWLWALVPLGFILLRMVRPNSGYNGWEKVVDRHLLQQLLHPAKQGRNRDLRAVLALAWLLAVLALAGPSWEKLPPVKFQPDVPPLVVVLDLSRSMQARDLHPSRLAVAKSRLHTLLQQLPPRPVGLVVYASQAHTAMPLTQDKRLIIRVLGELTTGIMPSQGSNPSAGLTHAATLLSQTQAGRGDILLITDGVAGSAVNTAKQLTASGYQTSVLAVGSLAGSKIPDEEGRGYLVSENRTVRVAVNEPALRTLAESGNGSYARISNSGDDVTTILRGLGKARHNGTEGQTGEGEVWREGGHLFLLLILPLALLAFRRGAIAVLLLCIVLPAPRVEALSWDSLWWNSDQRALMAMQERRPWDARELFTNPLWRGVAEYRAGDFHAALKSFSRLDSAQAHYNRGNTLMHLGRTDEAVAAYRRTLKLEPGHGDASFNLELAQRRTQQQPASTQDAAGRPADLQQPPELQDNTESLYAEDLLDTLSPEELSQESGEAPEDLDKIGHMGGGAMLIPGAEQPQGPESPGIGQGLDDGKEMERESDLIARQSRQARETRSKSKPPTDTAENRFTDPARPEAETRDTESASEPAERASAAMVQNSDSATPEPEQDQQGSGERQRKGAQDSASPPPDLPTRSTQAGKMNREDAQAVQQWLDRIPEGQSGLLKEKFLRDYRRHPGPGYGGDPW